MRAESMATCGMPIKRGRWKFARLHMRSVKRHGLKFQRRRKRRLSQKLNLQNVCPSLNSSQVVVPASETILNNVHLALRWRCARAYGSEVGIFSLLTRHLFLVPAAP